MNPAVVKAIFKRNFVAYFVSPTGYVFLCAFAVLTAFATFVPNEFFNSNLANLDQLNRYLPFILLVFIPAITMSAWAEERRQGTDELLLTIPAGDFDVVLGKYLATVAIYSVALVFSMTSLVVLRLLGKPDLGLMFSTYFGYWLVGVAMLAIGMLASFLTNNLTVGFIMGMVFNAPLVFAQYADTVFSPGVATLIKRFSIAEQFRDFGRGVISFSSVVYFLSIVAVMLYLAMILIGRRHWWGGRDGRSLLGHYAARAVALAVLAGAVNFLLAQRDARADVTTEQLSAIDVKTKQFLADLKRPVQIDAYISPTVPESYVQTRLNILNTLREFDALGGSNLTVRIHNTEPLSTEEQEADKLHGIKGQQVISRTRGTMNQEEIFLGVAFTSGLDKVVVPFIDRGMPVEYELIRSIATVSDQKRKRIGVLATDAKLYGSFDMQTMGATQNELIITELEKQYEVVQVNADAPISERFDVLLAVQPSSLTQEQMTNFLHAVYAGQPTAIFEDPFPYLDSRVPGTTQPRQPQMGGMQFGQPPPQPKGDITPLWQALGVNFVGDQVIWQDYNPYPKIEQFPPEFVFIDQGQDKSSNVEPPFNPDSSISSGLQQMLYLFPGAIQELNASGMTFTPLVTTGHKTGVVPADEILQRSFMGGGGLNPQRSQQTTRKPYHLAALIMGKDATSSENNASMSDEGYQLAQAEPGAPPAAVPPAPPTGAEPPPVDFPGAIPPAAPPQAAGPLKVVLVADIDVLYSAFFSLRQRGEEEDAEVNLNLDNVSFVLNALDMLADDDRFIDVRKRRPAYRTLTRFEEVTAAARDSYNQQRDSFTKELAEEKQKAQEEFDRRIKELEGRTDIDPQQLLIEVQLAREVGQRRLDAAFERLQDERDRKLKEIERTKSETIRREQNFYKLLAVAAAPLFPLFLAGVVMFNLRVRERQSTSKSRLRD